MNAIAHGIDGSAWFGLDGGGIRRYNPNASTEQWTSFPFDPFAPTGVVQQIVADQFGALGSSNIWAVCAGVAIYRFKPRPSDLLNGDWEIHSTPNIPTNYIYSAQVNYVDRTVWFGTQYGDIVWWNGSGWNNDNIPHYTARVNAIAVERTGVIWFGTVAGSFRRSISWDQFDTTGNKLPSNTVHAIAIEASGVKWFGTDNGLARFDNSTWQIFTTANSPLPSNTINVLTIDDDGKMWIGTPNGAVAYDPNGKE